MKMRDGGELLLSVMNCCCSLTMQKGRKEGRKEGREGCDVPSPGAEVREGGGFCFSKRRQ